MPQHGATEQCEPCQLLFRVFLSAWVVRRQVTGAPRGYLLLGAQPLADSVLLTLGRRNRCWALGRSAGN